MTETHLSLIIPAYNESRRLPNTLDVVTEYLETQQYSWEIIIVDDGSIDGTADLAHKRLSEKSVQHKIISLAKNSGKGLAVKTGIEAASGSFVFFSDADLSTPIQELERTLHLLKEGHDIVIGSRGMKDSNIEVRQNLIREYGGRTFNLMVRMLALPGIIDTQCGFKGFRAEVILPITSRQKLYGFSFDVELLWIARKLGFKIAEVPVTWRNDPESKVNVIKDSLKMILDVLRMRIIHRGTDFTE